MADTFDLFLVHQLGHALLQGLFVHLVGQLVHHDALALAFVNVFKVALGPHDHTAAACAVAIFHAIDAINNAGSREVGCGNDFHQFVDGGTRVAQHVQASVNHFVQIMRWNIGRHADRNAARAVYQ